MFKKNNRGINNEIIKKYKITRAIEKIMDLLSTIKKTKPELN